MIHEARPRQRSERRPDRLDQEERRRRREHERRTTDSRLNRNDRDHRSDQRPSQNKRSHETSSRKESDRGGDHDRERRRKSSPKPLRIKKVLTTIISSIFCAEIFTRKAGVSRVKKICKSIFRANTGAGSCTSELKVKVNCID